ncbi:hypothetical protein AB0N89_30570 [Amycolatopsis sp. NPDC089917]|uniref:hypothetical protein n=1 Tax=Amycolatopsis sp. NPDC089917 TaxID=3155187 RepID=UPI003417EBAC
MSGTVFRSVPGVPRWAKWSAHTVALVNLPVRRLAARAGRGDPFGLAQSELDALKTPGWGSLYLVFLAVFSEAVAFLALGLVQPWGETWPRWIPFVGGKPVSARKVVITPSLGVPATTVYAGLFVYTTLNADMAGDWLIAGAAPACRPSESGRSTSRILQSLGRVRSGSLRRTPCPSR